MVEKHTCYVGDDTGLIKKVRMIARRIEEKHEVRYDVKRPDPRRKVDADGNPIILQKRNKGVLGNEDNQTVLRHKTELTFKL